MSLIDRVRETLGSSEEERSFRYHCRECDREFETETTSQTKATCPTCGATGARSISKL